MLFLNPIPTRSLLPIYFYELKKDGSFNLCDQYIAPARRAFSILVVSEQFPDEMIAFKNGPPLILGSTAKEVVVASDLQAIMPVTNTVIYLGDHEIAYCKKYRCSFLIQMDKPLKNHLSKSTGVLNKSKRAAIPILCLRDI